MFSTTIYVEFTDMLKIETIYVQQNYSFCQQRFGLLLELLKTCKTKIKRRQQRNVENRPPNNATKQKFYT